jgi:mRNA-degrading endonuclease toxin of MazEF toxin-antitoxin module
MARRGDVVRVDFPFTDIPQTKNRPAVVIRTIGINGKSFVASPQRPQGTPLLALRAGRPTIGPQ